jgi:hypothetical protein
VFALLIDVSLTACTVVTPYFVAWVVGGYDYETDTLERSSARRTMMPVASFPSVLP